MWLKKLMTTSRPPLQKYIHGSPGKWSRISWDPWSTLWDWLVYKIRAFIHWMNSTLGFDTHKAIVWTTGALRNGHVLCGKTYPQSQPISSTKNLTSRIWRHRVVATRRFPVTRDSRENSNTVYLKKRSYFPIQTSRGNGGTCPRILNFDTWWRWVDGWAMLLAWTLCWIEKKFCTCWESKPGSSVVHPSYQSLCGLWRYVSVHMTVFIGCKAAGSARHVCPQSVNRSLYGSVDTLN